MKANTKSSSNASNVLKTAKLKFFKPVILCALALCSATAFAQSVISEDLMRNIEQIQRESDAKVCSASEYPEALCKAVIEGQFRLTSKYDFCIANGVHSQSCRESSGDFYSWNRIDSKKRSDYHTCWGSKERPQKYTCHSILN